MFRSKLCHPRLDQNIKKIKKIFFRVKDFYSWCSSDSGVLAVGAQKHFFSNQKKISCPSLCFFLERSLWSLANLLCSPLQAGQIWDWLMIRKTKKENVVTFWKQEIHKLSCEFSKKRWNVFFCFTGVFWVEIHGSPWAKSY